MKRSWMRGIGSLLVIGLGVFYGMKNVSAKTIDSSEAAGFHRGSCAGYTDTTYVLVKIGSTAADPADYTADRKVILTRKKTSLAAALIGNYDYFSGGTNANNSTLDTTTGGNRRCMYSSGTTADSNYVYGSLGKYTSINNGAVVSAYQSKNNSKPMRIPAATFVFIDTAHNNGGDSSNSVPDPGDVYNVMEPIGSDMCWDYDTLAGPGVVGGTSGFGDSANSWYYKARVCNLGSH